MRATGFTTVGSLFLAAVLALPAMGAPRIPNDRGPAQPGTVNYVEGQATIDGVALSKNSAATAMQAGQTIATQNGKAEVLLTPGVFLRLDSGSAARLDAAGLANTAVTLTQGRAMVEADDIQKANDIVINEGGFGVRLMKRGLYEFDATAGQVRVFDGQADLMNGNKKVEIGGGHELALNNNPKFKTHGFDKKAYENDELYRWSSLRASYLAEANASTAKLYVNGGYGWYGPGWYWSPWYSAYTWIPGDGIFWGPFGWGFFSPWYAGYAPLYFGYGYGLGYHYFGPGYRPPVVAAARPFAAPRAGGFVSGGVHTGVARGGFTGGGFHGGFAAGGFHGGGFGGRR